MDNIIRATSKVLPLRYVILDVTESINEIGDSHGAGGPARKLLGDAAVSSLILASGLKHPGVVQLRYSYTGDISYVHADATPVGLVRAVIPQEELIKLGNKEPVLKEHEVTVIKRNEYGKILKESITPMVSLAPGKALAGYLMQSEQTPSSVGIFSRTEGDRLSYCAGFLMEAFPNATDEELKTAESFIQNLQDPHTFYSREQGFDLQALLVSLSGAKGAVVHKEFPVKVFCPCTEKSAEQGLESLGPEVLQDYLNKEENAEITCEFCRKKYIVNLETIAGLLKNKSSD